MGNKQMSLIKAMAFGTSIASTLAALVGGGYLLGRFLDQRWGTAPWIQLGFMILGLAVGGSYLVVSLRKFGISDDKNI